MLIVPSHHAYTADELKIEGDAIGGLVLFYNKRAFSGILTIGEDILANLRGWQFVTEKKAVKARCFYDFKTSTTR